MKIYILADMEGISGIRTMEQVKPEFAADYEEGRRLMMQEINVCIDGAFAGGATEVVVADTHGGGGQIRIAEMDGRAVYEIPGAGRMMPSLDASFAGVILLGHHARAGTIGGFLDHTFNSSAWFEFRINGEVAGEIAAEAAWASQYDVPVIMVSGDEATCQEARETLGAVECAVVKWGIWRNRARCLPLPQAHQIIQETAQRAVRRAHEFAVYKPALPATVQITFYRTDMCEDFAYRMGIERVDARTIRTTIHTFGDVTRWVRR